MSADAFEECTRDLLGLPALLTRPVMRRINLLVGDGGCVTVVGDNDQVCVYAPCQVI